MISQTKFAQKTMAILAGKYKQQGTFHYVPEEFLIQLKGDKPWTLHLHNAYKLYVKSPFWSRNKTLSNFISGIINQPEIPKKFDEAIPHLFPAIRDSFMLEVLRLESPEIMNIAHNKLHDRLVSCLVFDTGPSMQIISEQQLAEWNVTFETAFKLAKYNLQKESPEQLMKFREGIYHSPSEDDYDSSRFLIEKLMNQVPFEHKVLFIPDRNHLWVADGNNKNAIKWLLKEIREADPVNPLSSMPFSWNGDTLENWNQPGWAESEVKTNRYLELNQIYAQQKDLLTKYFEKQDRDVYVATYYVFRNKETSTLISCSILTKDVETYLPRTDLVELVDPDQKIPAMAPVPWERFQQVMEIPPGEFTPPRHLVNRRFTAEELNALRIQ
jgi:hypothetical protein